MLRKYLNFLIFVIFLSFLHLAYADDKDTIVDEFKASAHYDYLEAVWRSNFNGLVYDKNHAIFEALDRSAYGIWRIRLSDDRLPEYIGVIRHFKSSSFQPNENLKKPTYKKHDGYQREKLEPRDNCDKVKLNLSDYAEKGHETITCTTLHMDEESLLKYENDKKKILFEDDNYFQEKTYNLQQEQ